MLSGYRITVLLLLLLVVVMMMMMTAVTKAQSGDEDSDIESRIRCTPHITTNTSTLTCNVVGDENDSEDDEDRGTDDIEEMNACYTEENSVRCVKNEGNTISFTDLTPVIVLEVTFRFKSGRTVKKTIDLKKTEPRISCTSHITTSTSTLTCNAVGDENDRKTDDIEEMKACYTELNSAVRCVKNEGDTISFTDLTPVIILEVTFRIKNGRTIKKMIDLKKIVKPRSPQVWNVTFHMEPYQAFIHVGTPYHDDYLTTRNQLFQLHIWTATYSMTQNISSMDKIVMRIDEDHLRKNTKYQVKVRAIPNEGLQGTWSEWSKPYNFSTPPENNKIQILWDTYTLIVCLVLILVVTSGVILSLKNKIITYVCPSIPHPKKTLLLICNPNTHLVLNVKPDVFSVLKVYSMEETDAEPVEESEPLDATDGDESSLPCSSQSSDCSRSANSVSTEDLELSALLSRSSSDEEGSLQNAAPSPIEAPGTPQSDWDSEGKGALFGVNKQEEAYVTMSSFYQIQSVQKQ